MMKKFRRKSRQGVSFKSSFFAALLTGQKNNENKSDESQDELFAKNDFPENQDFFTTKENCVRTIVDYSYYTQSNIMNINPTNKSECFNGILRFIYVYSSYHFNTNELAFFFTDAKNKKDHIPIRKREINEFNIVNLFDYTMNETGFSVPIIRNAYLGVVFMNIKIKPSCYAIALNYAHNCLDSFVFEGYDEDVPQWDILDERSYNSADHPDFCLFYTHTTNKSYSHFRIRQTCTGTVDLWGFFISGFEIFGEISIRDQKASIPEIIFDMELTVDEFIPFV